MQSHHAHHSPSTIKAIPYRDREFDLTRAGFESPPVHDVGAMLKNVDDPREYRGVGSHRSVRSRTLLLTSDEIFHAA